MRTFHIKNGIISVLLALTISDAAFADSMVQQRGRYWSWTAPGNWRHSESIAGVTLVSPDGRYTAALLGLMRSSGQSAPKVFLVRALGMGYQSVRISQERNLPRQQMGYQMWDWIEAEVTATEKNGAPLRGSWKSGVSNYYKLNDALVVGYWAPPAEFEKSRSWLAPIAASIKMINSAEAFGNNQLISPRNNPNTSADGIMQSWKDKNKLQDKSMLNWSNTMRGSQSTFDPSTGTRYSTPNDSWNGVRGGYVNPQKPGELLRCGTPENPQPCR
jgi:hypothetical protein